MVTHWNKSNTIKLKESTNISGRCFQYKPSSPLTRCFLFPWTLNKFQTEEHRLYFTVSFSNWKHHFGYNVLFTVCSVLSDDCNAIKDVTLLLWRETCSIPVLHALTLATLPHMNSVTVRSCWIANLSDRILSHCRNITFSKEEKYLASLLYRAEQALPRPCLNIS